MRLRHLGCLRLFLAVLCVAALLLPVDRLAAQTVARCGKGWLELMDGYPVLHLKGTPREMGYQHGALLRDKAASNMHNLMELRGEATLVDFGPVKVTPRQAIQSIIEIQKKHVPPKFFDELAGLAEGSGLKLDDVRCANFIPEMFHCSGFAIANSATKDGTLYHGRVLDYATDWGLQEHALLIVAEPDDGIPFVSKGETYWSGWWFKTVAERDRFVAWCVAIGTDGEIAGPAIASVGSEP